MKKTAGNKIMTAALICTMLFSLTAYASEEEVLVVNPDAAQLSAEETQQMVEEASRAFYQNGELKKELESEIEFKKEEVETEDEYDEEREFYVLTHNGVSMSFFMETIGEPDENGDPELACIGKITYSELVGDAQ